MVKRSIEYSPADFGETRYLSEQLDSAFNDTGYVNGTGEYGVDIGNATFDVAGGTVDDVWTLAAHGMVTGTLFQFDAVGTGAEGFTVDTDYFAIEVPSEAGEFQVAASRADAVAGTQIEGTDANSSGTWSVTVQPDYLGYRATGNLVLSRMLVHLEDTTGFQSVDYGNMSALTNGVVVEIVDADDTVIDTLTDRLPVKNNANWGAHCYDVRVDSWGSGNEMLAVRWTFASSGTPILLKRGEAIRVFLNDDMSGLISHLFTIQGYQLGGHH